MVVEVGINRLFKKSEVFSEALRLGPLTCFASNHSTVGNQAVNFIRPVAELGEDLARMLCVEGGRKIYAAWGLRKLHWAADSLYAADTIVIDLGHHVTGSGVRVDVHLIDV